MKPSWCFNLLALRALMGVRWHSFRRRPSAWAVLIIASLGVSVMLNLAVVADALSQRLDKSQDKTLGIPQKEVRQTPRPDAPSSASKPQMRAYVQARPDGPVASSDAFSAANIELVPWGGRHDEKEDIGPRAVVWVVSTKRADGSWVWEVRRSFINEALHPGVGITYLTERALDAPARFAREKWIEAHPDPASLQLPSIRRGWMVSPLLVDLVAATMALFVVFWAIPLGALLSVEWDGQRREGMLEPLAAAPGSPGLLLLSRTLNMSLMVFVCFGLSVLLGAIVSGALSARLPLLFWLLPFVASGLVFLGAGFMLLQANLFHHRWWRLLIIPLTMPLTILLQMSLFRFLVGQGVGAQAAVAVREQPAWLLLLAVLGFVLGGLFLWLATLRVEAKQRLGMRKI